MVLDVQSVIPEACSLALSKICPLSRCEVCDTKGGLCLVAGKIAVSGADFSQK